MPYDENGNYVPSVEDLGGSVQEPQYPTSGQVDYSQIPLVSNQPGDNSAFGPDQTSGGFSQAQIAQLGQGDVSMGQKILSYASQVLGLSPSQIADLVKTAGSLAAVGLGIMKSNGDVRQLQNSLAQTGQYNKQAFTDTLVGSNPNISGPTGNVTWSGPDAQGRYTQNVSLTPGQQGLLTGTENLGAQANTAAGNLIGGIDFSKGINYDTQVPMFDMSKAGAGIGRFDPTAYGRAQTDPGQFGPIQKGLDYSGAPAMPVANQQVRDQVVQNFIMQQKDYFDQEWGQRLQDTDVQLRNEGLVPGSEPYNRQMQKVRNDMGQAWNQVTRNAVVEGTNAMNTLFGEQMASRQQGVGEITQQGTYANQAQQQGASQALARMAAANAGQQQNYSQGQTGFTTNLGAQGQEFNQYATGVGANQTGQQIGFNQAAQRFTTPLAALPTLATMGRPMMPNVSSPTAATMQQAQPNPLLGNMAATTAGNAGLGNVTGFLTQTLPNMVRTG